MAFAFRKLPLLGTASLIVYTFVQLPITVVAAFQWKRKAADELSVLPAFMIGSIIRFSCYWLAPAIGPKVYFAEHFPLMHATPAYLDRLPLYDFNPHHPRNDMPSMHFAWAVCCLWRRWAQQSGSSARSPGPKDGSLSPGARPPRRPRAWRADRRSAPLRRPRGLDPALSRSRS